MVSVKSLDTNRIVLIYNIDGGSVLGYQEHIGMFFAICNFDAIVWHESC